ncbi:MAG: hypothetical protein HYX80_00235 [Chloroflexi bacterium]|nr:hypothetical protein [Chloroflexota bacterium]
MSLRDLYLKYRDRFEFLTIYIREAHPIDGWWLGGGAAGQLTGWLLRMGMSGRMKEASAIKPAIDIYDPKTIEERQTVAQRCENTLGYEMTTLVDAMDDAVNTAYAAHPNRLYLVGADGRIAYAGGLGPFGYKPAELGEAIEKYLAK